MKKNAWFVQNKKYIKPFLTFVFLLMATALQSQIISITTPDVEVQESTATNSTIIQFNIRKGPAGISLPTYNVNYSISGTTINGIDHEALTGQIVIAGGPNVTVTTLFVEVFDDDLVENDETLTITIEDGLGYFVNNTDNSATSTIVNSDVGTFSITVFDPEAAEENQNIGRFRIFLDNINATGVPVTVPYELTPAATNGADASDYTVAGQAVLSYPSGGIMVRQLNIIPNDDDLAESDEAVVLTLGTPSNPSFVIDPNAGTAEIVIVDNDCSAGNDPPIIDNNPTAFCDVDGVDLDSFFSSNLPPNSVLRWSLVDNPTTESQLLTNAVASEAPAGSYYAVFWAESEDCFSPATQVLEITIDETPVIGTATSMASCNTADNGGATTLDLNTTLNGSDPGGTWIYISGPEIVNPDASGTVDFNNRDEGTYLFQYELSASGACEDQSLEVAIPVTDCDPCIAGNQPPPLNPDTQTTFCDDIMVSLNDFTDAIAPAGTALTWSTTSDLTNTNAHLSPGEVNNPSIGVYYGFYYDSTNDCASPPLTITLVQNTTPTITEGTGETRCGPGEVTLMGSATGNATFNWYASETGGAILETGETFTLEINQTTTFYLEATENGCATSSRVPVVATILVQPSAGTAIVNASSCNDPEFGSTTIDLDDLLTDADVGEWSFTSGPEEVPFTSANMVDFNDEDDGTYEYTFTTTGAESPCVNESVTVSISVSSCDTDDDGDGLLGGVEAAIGTDPNNDDSDGDGIKDDVEVGPDINNPLDEDGDGIIDALDSNDEDSDNDGVVDQEDPGNDNACIPDINNDLCEEPIDLEVVKTIDNPDASIGDEVTFTITVTNLGPRRAKSVLIGDFLESGFDYISHNVSSGSYDEDNGQWEFENLEVNENESLTIMVLVVEDADEMYTNTAELLASDPLDSNPDNNSSTIALGVEQPEGVNLVIEKTARLSADSERLQNLTGLISGIDNDLRVEYFIKVSNKSLNDAVSNIRVTDVFSNPSNVIFEIIEEVVPQGSTFDASSGIWTINRQLAIDEEIELSYTVAFRSRGIVVNTAEVTGSSPRESTSEDEDSRSAVTVEVTTRNPLDIGILYNQFSPNADGINDFLEVNRLQQNESGIDTLVNINYDIEIYDRYGSLVYEAMSVTEEEAWDGTWKGKQVPDGTYFYALNVMVEGETEVKTSKGWIQLIR